MANAIRWMVGAALIYLAAASPKIEDIPFFAHTHEQQTLAIQPPTPDSGVALPDATTYHNPSPAFACTSACDFGVILSMAR